MGRWLVVYSSVTGNTKKVAEAFCEAVGGTLAAVEDAKMPEGFDAVAVGYWLWRGGPDPKTAAYLSKLSGVNVALFETHAAENRSEHSVTAFARAAACLGKNCRVLNVFECQGQVPEQVREKRAKLEAEKSKDPHAKAQGWKTSVGHPGEADLAAAKEFALRTDKKLSYFLKKGDA
ncbi:MAG: flavodoxin [Schwartzia sp.]|nr:flavodoxin [Schwartzia sp. (in: firmicutes)]